VKIINFLLFNTIWNLIKHKKKPVPSLNVLHQHFTNAIENFFSVFKSRLQKKIGITYQELKSNIKYTIKDISNEIMLRIFKGSYERDEKYKRKSSRKTKRKSKQYKE
jgi:hypothetical protein